MGEMGVSEWIAKITEVGVVGMSLVAVIMLVDFIRKRFRESNPGDRRSVSTVSLSCPNKIHELPATLSALIEATREQTRLGASQLEVLKHNREGIDRLVDQHRPSPDGRETWKIPPRMEMLQEETRDLLRELVMVVKKNGFEK